MRMRLIPVVALAVVLFAGLGWLLVRETHERDAIAAALAPLPAGAEAVECPPDPFVLLAGGQSNGANNAGSPTPKRPEVPAFMWFAGECYLAQDPLPGVSERDGSIWVLLAQQLAEREGQPVLLIPHGFGGTSFEQWYAAGSPHFERMAESTRSAAEAGYRIDLVLWFQGESDATIPRDVEGHTAEIARLLSRMRSELPIERNASIVLVPATRCSTGSPEGSETLRRAFRQIAAEDASVFLGPDSDTLGDAMRRDGCHLNDAGRDAMVAGLLDQLGDGISPR